MISVKNVTKKFGKFEAIKNISCNIQDGCIYGLVGVNGAGKSTLLRTVVGIYKCDSGSVTVDGKQIYDNPSVKQKIAFVPDELYLPPNMTLGAMADKYAALYRPDEVSGILGGRGAAYRGFNYARFTSLISDFGLKTGAQFNQFSKGMKRQAATALALALEPKYIFFDETFDGLDPFKRNYVKRIIAEDVKQRGATAVITSHSLRELEDTCDQLALLNRGGLVFESDTNRLRTSRFKLQVAFTAPFGPERFSGLNVISYKQTGSVANLIIGEDREAALAAIRAMSPALMEELPMTLEEVFTFELASRGLGGDIL